MKITRRKVILLLFILSLFSCKKTTTGSDTLVITFPDANFETLIRQVLDKPSGNITDADMLTITVLDGEDRNIRNISGIENCTNLQELYLYYNQIIDISALSALTNIQSIGLGANQIIDISALGALTNLLFLHLGANQIIDISALSALTNLKKLWSGGNQIIDISALSALTNLHYLDLWSNRIIDIYPLIQNSGIDNGDEVFLTDNPLSETSINTYIPQLEARGVDVTY